MQTNLTAEFKDTSDGVEAEAILRTCVHCGFCLATCPTYQLLGDELDSPRGRIYLIKQVLEGATVTEKTQLHLDRCLTCRACETTCPSGVKYGNLIDIGRRIVEKRVGRGALEKLKRRTLRTVLSNQQLFGSLLRVGQSARAALPKTLRDKVPPRRVPGEWPPVRHRRKMLTLAGCVQPSLAPNINAATARVLDRLGISLISDPDVGCCGALDYHMNAQVEGLEQMRRNVSVWIQHLDRDVEAVVMTASGCGTLVKEYGHVLAHDLTFGGLAARVAEHTKDLSEVMASEAQALTKLFAKARPPARPIKVAYHPPCSLQHAQKLKNAVEPLLALAGFDLTPVPDAHLCCGSAGSYSLLQPALSQQLLRNKAQALESGAPEVIATANIGCLAHIQSGTGLPVRHWIELIDERLSGAA